MILQTRTLHNKQTVYTGSGQLRNTCMSRSNHAYEGQTGIGNFREENKRCELPVSSWGTEEYQDQSKDILKSILNEDILSVSDSEEQIKES